jgi:uncharacterized protein (DUF305 family)
MSRISSSLLASTLLGAALALATTVSAHDPKKPAPTQSMAGHSAGSMELHGIMTQGQKMPMPMSGDVDKDFAAMMTMHHEQAIKMADVLLQHGRDENLKALAQRMKDGQKKEITELAPFKK